MNHLKRLLTRKRALATSAVAFFLVVALLGFADATYLTVEHYLGVIPPCSLTGGCEKVLSSAYSVILGVPVSLLGALYYLVLAVGAFMYLESKHISQEIKAHHHAIIRGVFVLTVAGLIFSLWFVVVQAFLLHAYCMYCLGSALTSTILFVSGMIMLRRDAREPDEVEVEAAA